MNECIFCNIVAGTAPSHIVHEDDAHVAFLSIFPNTEAVTVVIPKQHHGSYVVDVPDSVSDALLSFAKKVAKKIDTAYEDVDRCAFVFEGFGVDHLHIKLFPLHGTTSDTWRERKSDVDKYFEFYEGHISSHDHKRADDATLAQIAERIRKAP